MNGKDTDAIQDEYAKKCKALSDTEMQDWLALDTWTVEEGLLLIVGIDPRAAVVEWGGWVSALGAQINKIRIRNARPLSMHPVFFVIPPPVLPPISYEGLPGPATVIRGGLLDTQLDTQEEEVKWEKIDILQKLEDKLTRVNRLWISGLHDRQRYPVTYFLEWAEKKDIEIPWLSHSREMGWLPVSMKCNEVVVLSGVTDEACGGVATTRNLTPGRIAAIVKTARYLGYDPLAVAVGGKADIERECLEKLNGDPHRFTADTFKKAWQAARDKGQIDVVKADIYRGQ